MFTTKKIIVFADMHLKLGPRQAVDLDKREIELIDETPKKSIHRFSCFTPEAKELLELWIPERKRMLQKRYKTSKYVRDQLENNGYKVKREDIYNLLLNEENWYIHYFD